MIIVRKRKNTALAIALVAVMFVVGFIAGAWFARDDGSASKALQHVEKLEQHASELQQRVDEAGR